MSNLFDQVSSNCSKDLSKTYRSGFSIGIQALSHQLRESIYSIYAFATLAEEIVNSLENRDKKELLSDYSNETYKAIARRFSLNPILNSFQMVINKFRIDTALVSKFLKGIELKIYQLPADSKHFELYTTGATEALGLMILKVLCDGNHQLYETLETPAKKFSSAILKLNRLKNSSKLHYNRGTSIGIHSDWLSEEMKLAMELSIEADLKVVKENIKKLPQGSQRAIYIVFAYYNALFKKIKKLSLEKIIVSKIGISYNRKFILALDSLIKQRLNLL
ncbi:MAG: squalene/phytoene synthase family protein [Sporocytophaga sp.]|uniref:squalene/phytoene synthase family protein n=1 Tax=Sporocytophaga sp. TaxID=2231183 RepID=UPI001B1D7765|nr:squalene/phytoene synthase family protein [Sporocytophaga sp.]MBO9701468.1 squalene/phytoene synthase family protein [Sporocytophaga sp.]